MRSFVRFVGLSGLGWLFDCALLLALTRLASLPMGAANFISSISAAVLVFLVSRSTVFKPAGGALPVRLMAYVGYQVLGISVASLMISPASHFGGMLLNLLLLPVGTFDSALVGKVVITPPQLVANFLVSRLLIETAKSTSSHE